MIAAVEGHAVAGGLELAAWCDLRVAAEDAVFGVYCRRWGIPLMDGGTIRLARLIGHSHALDLILTGRGVERRGGAAHGAREPRSCRPGEALPEAIALAHEIASRPQAALRSDRLLVLRAVVAHARRGARERVPPRDGDARDRRAVRRPRPLRVGRLARRVSVTTHPPLAIEATGLVKAFGEVKAVDGVDLAVRRGSVYGVLGPNGAGKTTTIRMLATLLRPDAGSARVLGHDIVDEGDAVRALVSLTGQLASVDEDLSGRENLVLIGRLLGLRRSDAKGRAAELLEAFGLADAAGRLVKHYSGGMRRRLDLAASIVVTPELMFLDEPTTGSTRAPETRSGTSSARWSPRGPRSCSARNTSRKPTGSPTGSP